MTWTLAVDFGTTNTTAAYAREGGPPTPIALDGTSASMPSAVFLGDEGFDVGRFAVNRRLGRPQNFEGEPKRQVGLGPVMLGDRDVPVVELVAAILAEVKRQAHDTADTDAPDALRLTHPEAWSTKQRQLLREAAVLAGFALESIDLISEPVAAAHYYASIRPVAVGTKIAVVDFGGGTCDVAILELRADGGYSVVGAVGDNDLGGRDFDASLEQWVRDQLSIADPELAILFDHPNAIRARLTLRDSIRLAKEELSSRPTSHVTATVGDSAREISITRAEYETLIAERVGLVTALLTDALERARLAPSALASLYLTGGSSRTPAVLSSLTSAALTPERLDDPKLVVVQGALLTPAVSGMEPDRQLDEPHSEEGMWSIQAEEASEGPDQTVRLVEQAQMNITGKPYSGTWLLSPTPQPAGWIAIAAAVALLDAVNAIVVLVAYWTFTSNEAFTGLVVYSSLVTNVLLCALAAAGVPSATRIWRLLLFAAAGLFTILTLLRDLAGSPPAVNYPLIVIALLCMVLVAGGGIKSRTSSLALYPYLLYTLTYLISFVYYLNPGAPNLADLPAAYIFLSAVPSLLLGGWLGYVWWKRRHPAPEQTKFGAEMVENSHRDQEGSAP